MTDRFDLRATGGRAHAWWCGQPSCECPLSVRQISAVVAVHGNLSFSDMTAGNAPIFKLSEVDKLSGHGQPLIWATTDVFV